MIRRLDNKVLASRSQHTTEHVTVTIRESKHRQSKPTNRSDVAVVQHIHVHSITHERHQEEYIVVDKEREAATGRWVLNVIATHEAYQQALKANKKQRKSQKKQSFHSIKSSRVEPIEVTSVHQTQIKNQDIYPFPYQTRISPTTIGDDLTTPLSSFSSASSVEDIRLPGGSSISARRRPNSQSEDYSTEEFKEDDDRPCISKKIIIACTILAVLLILGIIIGVFITIFVGKSSSSSSTASASGKSVDLKSLFASFSTINDTICPTDMFNVTDPSCHGQVPYQYYSCYQMVMSTTLTIQFAFQHDTVSGHWYFDDISVVQEDNVELIINGGFEMNLTGWNVNISSDSTPEMYVDTTAGLAHTGSAYFNGDSKNSSVYIEQTFNVTVGDYVHISFWWGYDGGLNIGNTCQAIGQLTPLF